MSAAALLCLVIAVADGDTLTVRCLGTRGVEKISVRIAAIDAPERRQSYGLQARQSLVDLCLKRRAQIDPVEQDKYGRTVAHVRCQGQDVGEAQVRSGMAWVYTAYAQKDPQLVDLERQARAQRRGLWVQGRPLAPWSYRKRYAKNH